MQIGMLDRAGTFTHRQLLLFIILDSGNLPLLLKCGSDPSHSSFSNHAMYNFTKQCNTYIHDISTVATNIPCLLCTREGKALPLIRVQSHRRTALPRRILTSQHLLLVAMPSRHRYAHLEIP
jgi:hypothetical protein